MSQLMNDRRFRSPALAGPARPDRLPDGGHRAEAGERPPRPRLRRQPFPRLSVLSAAAIAGPLDRAHSDRGGTSRARGGRGDTPRGGDEHEPRHGPAARTSGRGAASTRRCPTASRAVLAATTIDDAREVYHAIRQASPAAWGRLPEQDVAGEPTVTLRQAMRLAAGPRPGGAAVCQRFSRGLPRGAAGLAVVARGGAAAGDGDRRRVPGRPGAARPTR